MGITEQVELKAYENDVLHALAKSGGLPGTAAKAEVTESSAAPSRTPANGISTSGTLQGSRPAGRNRRDQSEDRADSRSGSAPGEAMPKITRDDILLDNGDIMYIESREQEVFYTGGLLRGGQFPVPRDYDVDVLGAVAMAGGSIAAVAGGYGGGPGGSGKRRRPSPAHPPHRAADGRGPAGRHQGRSEARDDRPFGANLVQPNDFVLLEYTPMEVVLNVMLNNINMNLSLNSLFGQ